MDKKNVLVLGVGNDILTDDGIGPRLVQRLAKECPSEQVRYETACLGGLELVERMAGYRQAVFIDAIKTAGGTPGDVYFLTPKDFKATLHLSNIHDISFLNALELGRQLGFDIPDDIRIVAVEIVEDRVFGESFTPAVQARYEEIFQIVRDRLEVLRVCKIGGTRLNPNGGCGRVETSFGRSAGRPGNRFLEEIRYEQRK